MENTVEFSAMFWLRCNKCYRLMKKSLKTFSLTQCQHLFCSECIVGAEKKCPECGSRGVKIAVLAKPLQEPLLHYFENVGSHVQRAFEAAHFQGIQKSIALRRFADIQGKYEEMRRTYHQSADQMKTLVGAYTKLKNEHASIGADIAKLQSNLSVTHEGRVKHMTNTNFMHDSVDRRSQKNERMMTSSRSNHNKSLNDSGRSSANFSRSSTSTPEPQNWQSESSRNTSRSSIAQPFTQQHSIYTIDSSNMFIAPSLQEHQNEHPSQHQILQSGCHNRHTADVPEYRCSSNGQTVLLGYAPRVIASHVVTPMKDSRHLVTGWVSTNRMPGSAGISTDYSSTDGSMRRTPMVIDNYSDYS